MGGFIFTSSKAYLLLLGLAINIVHLYSNDGVQTETLVWFYWSVGKALRYARGQA